jgi:hypothetical protein
MLNSLWNMCVELMCDPLMECLHIYLGETYILIRHSPTKFCGGVVGIVLDLLLFILNDGLPFFMKVSR